MVDDSRKLSGKTALITGGASGIGLGIASRFVAEGAKVVLVDINPETLSAAEKDLGACCLTVTGDVTREDDLKKAVAEAVDKFGQLDIGINSAGNNLPGMIAEQDVDSWDFTMNLCLKGVFISMKTQAQQMQNQDSGGVIINISSLNAQQPAVAFGAYCAAKAGVEMLTRVGAMEMGPQNVRVCAIAPGLIDTPITQPFHQIEPIYNDFMENTLLSRSGKTDDVASAAVFLASSEASWITGHTLYVDGGAINRRYPDLMKHFADLGG